MVAAASIHTLIDQFIHIKMMAVYTCQNFNYLISVEVFLVLVPKCQNVNCVQKHASVVPNLREIEAFILKPYTTYRMYVIRLGFVHIRLYVPGYGSRGGK
jgi:hypothetical protein